MVKHFYIVILLVFGVFIKAQNPTNITIATVQAVTAIDTYTRATTNINLQATSLTSGFKYGFVTAGATNLLNLSISSYTSNLISSNYNDPTLNPFGGYNAGLVLGSSEGNYNVTPTGQLSYNLPIVCSPGTSGIEPKLSISYNSIGINGLMGIGFNLSGISAVNRVGSNKFADGKSGDISLTNSDFFAVDGARLFLNSGSNYGDAAATYVFQSINHQVITSFGNAGTGPQYFMVKDPKGFTIEYGNSADSRLTGTNDNSVLSWYINKITDEFGNYMTYTYNNTNGEVYVDKIEYTGNTAAGLQPYNKIQFAYLDRSDKNIIYYGGKGFNSTKLLKSIVCTDMNNQPVHKYFFDYQFSIYSLLNKITEADANDNQLNPTLFSWGAPGVITPTFYYNPSFETIIPAPNVSNLKSVTAADLNGDGYSDLVAMASNDGIKLNSANNPVPANLKLTKVAAQVNNLAKGSLTDLTFSAITSGMDITDPTTFSASVGSFVGDRDRDGREEVYLMTFHKTGPIFWYMIDEAKYDPQLNYLVLSNLYNGLGNQCGDLPTPNANIANNPYSFFFDTQDYNNDGFTDMIVVDQYFIRFKPGNGANQFGPTYGSEISIGLGSYDCVVKPGDFDGDGKIEFYKFYKSFANPSQQGNYNYEILKLNSNSTAITSIYLSPTITKNNTTNLCLGSFDVGDFNGDGKADVYSAGETGIASKIYVSTGTGFNILPLPTNVAYSASDIVGVSAEDLNGDNKSDVIVKKYTLDANFNATSSVYNVLYSFGANIIEDNNTYTQQEYTGCSTYGDFNADGNLDYFVTAFPTTVYQFIRYSHMGNQKNHFLTHIQSPKRNIGIEYSFSKSAFDYNNRFPNPYAPLYNGTDLYRICTMGSVTSPSLTVLNPAVFLVSKTQDNDKVSRYEYANPIFSKSGQVPSYQFIGFQQFKSALKDLNPSIYSTQYMGSITNFTYDPVYNVMSRSETFNGLMNYQGTNYQGTNGVVVATQPPVNYYNLKYFYVSNTSSKSIKESFRLPYATQQLNSQIFYTDKTYSKNIDYLNSTNGATTVQIDNGKQGNPAYITTESYAWNSTNIIRSTLHSYLYVLANGNYKVASDASLSQQQGDASYSRSINYTYDAAGHLISKVTDPVQPALSVTTTYPAFNLFGAPTQIVVSAPDIQSRSMLQTYDATGRFIVQRTNAIGNTEMYVNEPKYGNLAQSTDVSGLMATYQYDGMGMLVKTTLPNNAVNKMFYNWNSASAFDGSYSVTAQSEGAPGVVQLFDKNNNLLQTTADAFGGNTSISTASYDLWNRVLESTDQHFPSQASYKKAVYTYSIDPFYRKTKVSSIVYTGTDNEVTSYNYLYNNISMDNSYSPGYVQVSEPSNPSSFQKTITNAAGQTVNVYNTSTAKYSSYAYASNGQPKSITLTFPDGGAASTTINYDAIGRQSSLADQSSGTTSYQYNAIGELTTQITPNGTYTYAYDNLGRTVTKTGSGLGATSYQYVTAANGRQNVATITGPNNTTDFQYDVLGRITEQKETIGNKIFKTNYAYDKYGNITTHTFPNNYSVNYVYDNIGTQTQLKNGNTVIWQLNSESAPGLTDSYSYNNGGQTTALNYFPNNDPKQHFLLANKTLNAAITYGYDFGYENVSGDNKLSNVAVHRGFASQFNQPQEQYVFDASDRLTHIASNANMNISYKDNGNIDAKTDAGTYVYNNTAKPYNLSSITSPAANISLNTLSLQYNDLKKVSQVIDAVPNNLKQMDFTYGNNNERCRVDYSINGNNQYTRYYSTNYDRQEGTSGVKEWDYIYSATGLSAIYYNNNGNAQLLYVTTDKQGSPVLLTTAAGAVFEEYSYSAWGRRRNTGDWSYNNITPPQHMIRGYTGHEMLDEFALINMNGRVYDPVLGRFIQPDNFVESAGDLQTFNRYSYCRNNPLKYTDPSGNIFGFDDVAAILIGGVSNVISNWDHISAYSSEHDFWSSLGRGAEYFGAGAAGGEASLYLGPATGFAIGATLNLAIDAGNGVFAGDIQTLFSSGNVMPLLKDAGQSALRGGLSALAGAEAGAEIQDAKIASGTSEDFQSFKNFITGDGKFAKSAFGKAPYYGIKSVASGYAEDQYKDSKDLFTSISAKFVSGFIGSLIGDATEKVTDGILGKSKIPENLKLIFPKLAGGYLGNLTGNVYEGSINAAAKGKFNAAFVGTSIFNGYGTSADQALDYSLLIYMSILKK